MLIGECVCDVCLYAYWLYYAMQARIHYLLWRKNLITI